MRIFARLALLADGWAPDVAFEIAPDGTIVDVRAGAAPLGADDVIDGPVLPGMPNLHCHAFQRAMAGRAERRGLAGDDFWRWRELMYELAGTLEPDTLFAIARELYRALLACGYTAVAEFHYLHRDPRGAWYADKAATSRALIEAARDAGIAICLLPALYAQSDPSGAALTARQRRFATAPDDVLEIGAALRRDYANVPDVVVGTCAHSLRAVSPRALSELVAASPPDVPIHLHAAEQAREVDAVRAALGAAPVAWLLAHQPVDARWCLVHATHLDDGERDGLARTGAVAGLCPSTEANLGDGVFALAPYLAAGGAFGIGSDSNVSLSPPEELRWLEYGQRLVERRRIVAALEPGASAGESLYVRAARGGAQACGFTSGVLAPGRRADLVVLADGADARGGSPADVVDRYLFGTHHAAPRHVMVRGRWRVRDGVRA